MRNVLFILLVAATTSTPSFASDEFEQEVRRESAKLNDAREKSAELVLAGRLDEANAAILAVFPAESRTMSQAFVLGNVLFRHAPQTSYELHKLVAEKMPDERYAQLEWAMQQHRAGEFAGAADSYALCGKQMADFAPLWGLQADCLIRSGKIKEAVETWAKSENAKSGTLVQFETLLCEIKFGSHPDIKRAALIKKVSARDVEAAAQLISLDWAFDVDWWNSPRRVDLLEADLKQIQSVAWKDPASVNEIVCVAEVGLAAEAKDGDVAAVLKKHGYLLNAGRTLPVRGSMLSCMMSAVEDKQLVKPADEARKRWGAKILTQARASKDAEYFNVAAHLYVGSSELPKIQREGWQVTGDHRCATGVLLDLTLKREINLEHSEFVAIVKQFPEDSFIAGFELALTTAAKKPLTEALVRTIQAEFTKFSNQNQLIPRRGAATLRRTFGLLRDELAKEAVAEPKKP